MTTLFSPIGTADPLTQLGDGPMLHIVRHYNPDKVVLFLSKKMAAYEQACHLYTKAIELLSESLQRETPQIEYIESACDDVYKFDVYIAEFEEIFSQIASGKNHALVNTSSGTPAMAQALVALGSFGRFNLHMLQVTTPRCDANHAGDRENPSEWDEEKLAIFWEGNKDNIPEATCRILPVNTPNFSAQLLRENVMKLVEVYEYEAAHLLCGEACIIPEATVELIRAAADRLNLDGQLPSKVFGGTELSFCPNDLLKEYLYIMEVRLEQGHWADFVRSLSPALTEIMKRELAPLIPENTYNLYENGRPTGKYNLQGIRENQRLEKLFPSKDITYTDNKGNECGKYITNDSYWRLIREFHTDDSRVKMIQSLRSVEAQVRNTLAHEIKSSPKKSIEKQCGITFERIMKYLFELYGEDVKPGLYKRINMMIVQSI